MRQWVLSVPFPLRYLLASQPVVLGKVLAVVNRVIATHLAHKAGYTKTSAQAGALNLNIHFHRLFLDGVYARHGLRFRRVNAPSGNELTRLTHTIARRIGRYLERPCRYITRPALSTKRLSLTRNGQLRYELKTPWRNGTTHVAAPAHPCARGISASMHVIFEPLDFMYRTYGMPRAQEARERPSPGWSH